MKPGNWIDYTLLLLVALIWSTSFSAIKIGVGEIGPATLAAGRITLAAVCLWLWLAVIKRQPLPFSLMTIRHYLFVGLLGNAVPFTLIGIGEVTISSSLAAILMGLMPLITFALAALFLQDEKFNLTSLFGVALGFSGLLILVGLSALDQLGGEVRAQLLVLLGAASYATVTIYVRLFVTLPGPQIATGAMVMASIGTLIYAFKVETPLEYGWSQTALAAVIYLGLIPTALASLLYFHLVRTLGATTFAQINYLIPIFGSLIGIIWMGEPIQWRIIISLTLILSGIAFVRWSHP